MLFMHDAATKPRGAPTRGTTTRLPGGRFIQMDARRDEIVFSRMKNGVSEEIAGVDAEIASHGNRAARHAASSNGLA
jgi:hypothetical protein